MLLHRDASGREYCQNVGCPSNQRRSPGVASPGSVPSAAAPASQESGRAAPHASGKKPTFNETITKILIAMVPIIAATLLPGSDTWITILRTVMVVLVTAALIPWLFQAGFFHRRMLRRVVMFGAISGCAFAIAFGQVWLPRAVPAYPWGWWATRAAEDQVEAYFDDLNTILSLRVDSPEGRVEAVHEDALKRMMTRVSSQWRFGAVSSAAANALVTTSIVAAVKERQRASGAESVTDAEYDDAVESIWTQAEEDNKMKRLVLEFRKLYPHHYSVRIVKGGTSIDRGGVRRVFAIVRYEGKYLISDQDGDGAPALLHQAEQMRLTELAAAVENRHSDQGVDPSRARLNDLFRTVFLDMNDQRLQDGWDAIGDMKLIDFRNADRWEDVFCKKLKIERNPDSLVDGFEIIMVSYPMLRVFDAPTLTQLAKADNPWRMHRDTNARLLVREAKQ